MILCIGLPICSSLHFLSASTAINFFPQTSLACNLTSWLPINLMLNAWHSNAAAKWCPCIVLLAMCLSLNPCLSDIYFTYLDIYQLSSLCVNINIKHIIHVFLTKDKFPFIIHIWYYCCWWTGDARSHGNGIDIFFYTSLLHGNVLTYKSLSLKLLSNPCQCGWGRKQECHCPIQCLFIHMSTMKSWKGMTV